MDELPDIFVLKKAAPQVKAGKLPQHLHKTLVRRFVKAVQGFDLFQFFGVNALPAPVTQAAALGINLLDTAECYGDHLS